MGVTPWQKAHDALLEVHLHRMRLLVNRQMRLVEVGEPSGPDDPDEPVPGDDELTRLTSAIGAHESRIAADEHELLHLGGPDGITALVEVAGLDAFEREAVLAALCVELDPAIGDLFANLQDDPKLRHPSPSLLAALHQLPISEGWALSDPAGPTTRFRIFRPESGGAGAPIRLDNRVAAYLRGSNFIDERLAGLVTIMEDVPRPANFELETERLAGWLNDPQRSGGPVTIDLVGPNPETRRTMGAGVIRAVGLHPLRLHLERLVARSDRYELAKLIEREAVLLPAGLYLDELDDPGGDPTLASAAREIVENLGGLVVIGSAQRWDGERTAVVRHVPPFGAAERIEVWDASLGRHLAGIEAIVEQFTMGPESIWRAAGEAETLREIRNGDSVTSEDVWVACRHFVGRELGGIATRIAPSAGWDDLVLPDHQHALLREVAGQVRHRAKVYEEWGFGARLSRGRGISALFTGPPGTGKTMAAEIIAADLDLDLYRIDLASVVSKYIGETEKNLRRVFDAAEEGGAILFFDEADALFGKRTEVKDSHDRHANVEINYLLQRMEEYAGLAVLATNRKSDLDPAFLRRIRFLVAFPFPSAADRKRIWQTVFPTDLPRGDLDHDALARLDLAGGNIKNVAVNAAFRAAAAEEPLGMEHVLLSALHEYHKVDKRPTRAEFGEYYELVTT